MVPLIVGGAMMAGGTGLNMYGTMQRDKAQRRAMQEYQAAVNQKAAQDQAAMEQQAGVLSGFARERQGGIGQYITDLGMSERENPQDSAQFRQNQKGALTDLGKLTGGGDSNYAYQGAPRSASEGMQQEQTTSTGNRMAEAMLADHQQRMIQERQTNAAHKLSLSDLLRKGRGTTAEQRFALAKALRDLDWQKKSAALQGQLDEAGRKGQSANIIGGLATQAGGLVAMSGMGGAGAEGPAAMGGTGAYGVNSPGALDLAGPVGGGAIA